jgi:ribosomal protein S18 acetylase RimI-like enzyme
MNIIKANINHIDDILKLLKEVSHVHHLIRPDIFNEGTKYNKEQLIKLLNNDKRPIYVYVDNNEVLGYIFLELNEYSGNNLVERKEIYIDDLCVDESTRGKGIGKELFNFVKEYAKLNNYSSITLNVWEGNDNAINFYKKLGMCPLKTYMEYKIK